MATSLSALLESAFDACPEPLALVEGDEKIVARNRAFRVSFGESVSLFHCIDTADHANLNSARRAADEGPAALVARPALGPKAGFPMRWTIWQAGAGASCVRLDGPATPGQTLPAPLAPLAASGQPVPLKTLILGEIFERMDAVVWAIAKDGTILMSEGSGLAHFGLKPGQMVGVNALQIYPPGSASYEEAVRVLQGESVNTDGMEGKDYWIRFQEPLRDGRGDVTALIAVSICVTKDAHDTLQAKALHAAVGELPVVIWAMDPDGTCTLSAGRGLRDLGIESREMIGANLFHVYGDRPDFMEHMQRALGGERFSVETRIGDQQWRNHFIPVLSTWGDKVERIYAAAENVTERSRQERSLREQLELIQRQQAAIISLSSPIIEVWSGVLVVPLIGELEAGRAEALLEQLLEHVCRRQSSAVILDLTGVDVVEPATAEHLFKILRSVELVGCKGLVSGIRPSVAKIMVELGIELSTLVTHPTLAEALRRWINRRAPSSSLPR
ncbi:STAS domain-containing protein [Sorangium sp. So ce269]